MVFRKMLSALGVGAPSVDTVLPNPNTRPGLALAGQVNLVGGTSDAQIDQITVGLVTRVEMESAGQEYDAFVEFHRVCVAGGLLLRAGQQVSVPFEVPMPWETPVTDLYGQRLHGMTMGLRTEVAIRGAVDKGDLDPVHVHPLPVQERILEAFARLGFAFKGADLERGHLYGLHQSLPFYQEIEYFCPPTYAHGVREVELTFVADPTGADIVLEFDKRAGLFTGGHDSYGRYRVEHVDADRVDWAEQVDRWVRQAAEQRHTLVGPGYAGAPAAGFPPPGYPAHHGYHQQRHGSGVGGVVAGAALGFTAGMVAEEMFESFGGDEMGDEG